MSYISKVTILILLSLSFSAKRSFAEGNLTQNKGESQTQAAVETNSAPEAHSKDDPKPDPRPSLAEVIFDQNIIVPAIIFGTFGLIAFLGMSYSYRKRKDVIQLVHEAIKSGQPLPDSFLESLENKRLPTPEADLRKAVLLIALGISAGVIIFTVADPSEKAAAALGILPTLLGLSYLYLWKNASKVRSKLSNRIDE